MNTGEHLWSVPNGDTPQWIKDHAALEGIELPITGKTSHPVTLVTKTLVVAAEGVAGDPLLHARDKRTGELIASIEMPARGQYGMMSYLHDNRQYIVVQIASESHPGSLAALRLP